MKIFGEHSNGILHEKYTNVAYQNSSVEDCDDRVICESRCQFYATELNKFMDTSSSDSFGDETLANNVTVHKIWVRFYIEKMLVRHISKQS